MRSNSTNNDFPRVLAPVIALLLYFYISSSVDSNYSSQPNQRMMYGVRCRSVFSTMAPMNDGAISAEIFLSNDFIRLEKAVGVCLFAVVSAPLSANQMTTIAIRSE